MSGSEVDSELEEWEREQMNRGIQSKRGKPLENQSKSNSAPGSKESNKNLEGNKNEKFDINLVRDKIKEDIDRAQASIETYKRNIGATKLEMVKSEKRMEALRKRIERLESDNLAILNERKNAIEEHQQQPMDCGDDN